MKIDKNILIQFLKFGIVGLVNALVYFVVYYCFYLLNERLYLVGNIVGWIVSVANSFYWNRKFVFKGAKEEKSAVLVRALKTYISYGVTFLLSTIMLYIEVDVLYWSAILCPVLNPIIITPINFLLNKYWAFTKGNE